MELLQNWGGWIRTTNFPVNSRAVCQLTYTPMGTAATPHTVNSRWQLDAQTHSGKQV